MSPFLGDVDARARGLASHLLSSGEIVRLAHAAGCGALARELEARGYPSGAAGAEPVVIQVDMALRRAASESLGLLARWLGPRVRRFAVLFEDEARRALRSLLRSAGQGLSREARLAGTLATPALQESVLQRLAETESVPELVAELARSGNPYALPLRRALGDASGGLFELEVAVQQTFAARARSGARGHGRELAAFVGETLDLENAWTALLLDPSAEDRVSDPFLPGGLALTHRHFASVLREEGERERRLQLARVFARTPLAPVFEDPETPLSSLERRALRARIASQRRLARLDPLGPAPLLGYALALRAELHDLGRVAWGLEAGAPPDVITPELVATS